VDDGVTLSVCAAWIWIAFYVAKRLFSTPKRMPLHQVDSATVSKAWRDRS
jgi:hypothetical protein